MLIDAKLKLRVSLSLIPRIPLIQTGGVAKVIQNWLNGKLPKPDEI